MDLRFLRVISGALVLAWAATPSAATVITTKPANVRPARSAAHSAAVGGAAPRYVRLAGSRKTLALINPSGCSSNGPSSFVGIAALGDFAGGDTGQDGFAGVVGGSTNVACDGWSFVGGGRRNTLGGDSFALHAVITGGEFNGIESALDGFIGAGADNLLGYTLAPDNFPYYSAIVGGSVNAVASSYSFIGAGYSNSIVATTSEANGPSSFIGAGFANAVSGNFSSIVAGQFNSVAGDNAAILGGNNNSVGGTNAAVVGGSNNTVNSTGSYAAIAGGFGNSAAAYSAVGGGYMDLATGMYASIGGGSTNSARNTYATVGGGHNNAVSADSATVGGGNGSSASAEYATVAGGTGNAVSGAGATVGGGGYNSATATNATVPGGYKNVAGGSDSFAAGTSSTAAHTGTFVWSDDAGGATKLSSTASNQFLARAAGGFYFYSSANLASGVKLAPGSGSWSTLSDRAAKTAIAHIDGARILTQLAALPVSEWSYSAQGTDVRHLGPMAQDFRAAFGLGEDDRHISTVDEEGVALAAIKALYADLAEKNRKMGAMRRADDEKYARLEKRLDALEHTLDAMTGESGS